MIQPIEHKMVSFNGANLLGVKANDDKLYVGVKWVCQGMGLSEGQIKNERKRIQEDIVLSQGGRHFILPTNSGNQDVLCIELDFLPIWLAKISITPKMQQESPWVARALVEYQLKAKDVLAAAFLPKQPQTQLEILQSTINQMVIQEQRVKQLEQNQTHLQRENETLRQRIDTLDNVSSIGNLQQRFNEMVRKYARQQGIGYQSAWRVFTIAYNKAYGTNLTAKINNYKQKHGLKDLSRPAYFSLTETLEDAIRVIDEMLNKQALVAQ